VIVAAIIAAATIAAIDFNMTAPCFGLIAGAFLLSTMVTIGEGPFP